LGTETTMSGADAAATAGSETARRSRLELVSDVLLETTRFFHDERFVQLLPVMLGRSTDPLGPDPGSSILRTTELDYLGQRFYLMNSMILHKQIAVREVGPIWILSPNVRLERAERGRTGRHLFEFTQADFEMPGAKAGDVRSLVERYYARLGAALADHPAFGRLGVEPPRFRPPWRVATTHDLETEFGADWEGPASKAADQPFWAVCHRREFYDREDPTDPGHFLNYDLIYPGGYGEALSGAEREWESERIRARIQRDGVPPQAFLAYLELAHDLVPSAGAGFGIERLVRFVTKASHVGDVQMFRRVPGESVAL
jgi:asparaginyl-tRNA synthetase